MRRLRGSRARGASYVEVLVIVGVVVTLGAAGASVVAAGEAEKAGQQSACMQTFSCADGQGSGPVPVAPSGGGAAPSEGGGGVRGFLRDFVTGLTVGDFAESRGVGTTVGQVVGGFIPIWGQISDARDWGAAAAGVWQGRPGAWGDLGLATVGFIPGLGDGIKGAVRGGREALEGGARVARRGDELAPLGRRTDDAPGPARGPDVICDSGVCTMPGQCFAKGTPVRGAEGARAIELVAPGEWVLARDPETGAQALRRVTRTFVTPDKPVADLGLASGGAVEHLVVTLEHPFFVEGRGWTSVSLLAPGDPIATSTGQAARVVSLRTLPVATTVFNLEVEADHTYFVGATEALVHNTCTGGARPPRWEEQVRGSRHEDPRGAGGRGKHEQARTDDEARRLSDGRRGEAQYRPGELPNLHELEREALRSGHLVTQQGKQTIYAYYDTGRVVGYANGQPTTWIRVELTSGVVHSHPRPPVPGKEGIPPEVWRAERSRGR